MKSFSLNEKVAIITGANQGLGLEIARHYLAAGASVMLCARNSSLLTQVKETLSSDLHHNQAVECLSMDVSDSKAIELLVNTTHERFGRIDILVNNAGIYGPMGAIEEVDWEQWIKTIEVNLIASILLSRAILPIMKKQKKGKIIQISGGGATNPLPNISAYAVSKAGIVRFAETLAEETREFNIDVNAIAPGALNTRLLDEILAAGPNKVGQDFFDKSLKQKKSGGTSLMHGAELAVFLASDASNGITGKLISAVWDNWKEWPNYLPELKNSDIYTLRRIVGRDRGYMWGDK